MKKLLALVIALLLVSFSYHSAFAFDYSKLIPEKPAMILKVNLKGLFESGYYKSFQMGSGAVKKAQQEINAEIEKRLGFTFERDIQDFGIFVGAAADVKNPSPNNILIFVTGKFNSEKLFAAIEQEKKLPVTIETVSGKKQISFKKIFAGTFLNEETFIFGSSDMIEGLVSGKLKTVGPPETFKAQFEKSAFFLHFSLAAAEAKNLKAMFEGLANAPGIPAPAKNVIKNILTLSIFDEGNSFLAKAEFSDKSVGEDLSKMIEGARMMAKGLIDSQEKAADEKMKTASAFRLLGPEIAGTKLAAALGNDLLSSLEIASEGNIFTVKITVPEAYRNFLKPGALPVLVAVAGVGAAIAVPNFKRAKAKAQDKHCMANMKTLEGAVELYLMENGEPKEEITAELLKSKQLLKFDLKCPGNGTYKIIYNTGKPTVIECSVHGQIK